MRLGFRLAAVFAAMLIIGAWTSGLELTPYDDGQQITMELPADFTPAYYPHLLGKFAKYSTELHEVGGHSLVVDYEQTEDGHYHLQLGILGVNYSEANTWIRSVMERDPSLAAAYEIDQPLMPYRLKVKDMLAYKLGRKEAIERNVVVAWQQSQLSVDGSLKPRDILIIGREKDYMRKVSMLGIND